MALADANTRSLEERIRNLELRTDSKNLGFMQVKKETLRVAPLEVGLGDLLAGGPRVPMMLDLYLIFLQRQEEVFLGQICINFRW